MWERVRYKGHESKTHPRLVSFFLLGTKDVSESLSWVTALLTARPETTGRSHSLTCHITKHSSSQDGFRNMTEEWVYCSILHRLQIYGQHSFGRSRSTRVEDETQWQVIGGKIQQRFAHGRQTLLCALHILCGLCSFFESVLLKEIFTCAVMKALSPQLGSH